MLSLLVENTLHIFTDDNPDNHELVEPCWCNPTILYNSATKQKAWVWHTPSDRKGHQP